MPVIQFTQKGSFNHIEAYLARVNSLRIRQILEKYGAIGVEALTDATPQDSGKTASDWYYTIITRRSDYYSIRWHNRNNKDGPPVAVLIQYGHATRNGGWIEGRDYIMPAIKSVFDKLLREVMREVTK